MTNAATPRPHDNRVVRLPMYDKKTGETLPGYLQMDIGFFLEQSSRMRHDFKIVEFEDPTPAQEIDLLDRIVSGLPPRVRKPANPEGNAIYAKAPEGVKLYDVNSLYPTEYALREVSPQEEVDILPPSKTPTLEEAANTWVRIPKFDNYEINCLDEVRNRFTRRVLDFEKGVPGKYVEMHDKEGHAHLMSVDHISKEVFGK